MLEKVVRFIERERRKRGVKEEDLGTEPRFELSCIAFGEIYNLVHTQLLYTKEGYGSWQELKNEEILREVVAYIERS